MERFPSEFDVKNRYNPEWSPYTSLFDMVTFLCLKSSPKFP
jgi:hypothetical protein